MSLPRIGYLQPFDYYIWVECLDPNLNMTVTRFLLSNLIWTESTPLVLDHGLYRSEQEAAEVLDKWKRMRTDEEFAEFIANCICV